MASCNSLLFVTNGKTKEHCFGLPTTNWQKKQWKNLLYICQGKIGVNIFVPSREIISFRLPSPVVYQIPQSILQASQYSAKWEEHDRTSTDTESNFSNEPQNMQSKEKCLRNNKCAYDIYSCNIYSYESRPICNIFPF